MTSSYFDGFSILKPSRFCKNSGSILISLSNGVVETLSQLILYSQFNMRSPFLRSSDRDEVSEHLKAHGIRFENWGLSEQIADQDKGFVFDRYRHEIDEIKKEYQCLHADMITVNGGKTAISLRDKYLSEHVHTEPEIRFFLDGRVLVYIHACEKIYIVQCEAGDFIAIPAGIRHWFDMGPKPDYICLRWFNSEEGLQNSFTGSYIAESTPRWETVLID